MPHFMWAQASVIFNSTAMLARSALGSQRSRPRFKPGRVFAATLSIREQGISKAGNHRARKLAVELSWLWLRHQPGKRSQPLVRRAGRRRQGTHPAQCHLSDDAKLIVSLWRYLDAGVVPTGTMLRASF